LTKHFYSCKIRVQLFDNCRRREKVKKSIRRLPDAELEIMKIIWEANEPVTSAYISEKLKAKRIGR